MFDVSGLFFWQVIWEILVSKLGKINSFWPWGMVPFIGTSYIRKKIAAIYA